MHRLLRNDAWVAAAPEGTAATAGSDESTARTAYSWVRRQLQGVYDGYLQRADELRFPGPRITWADLLVVNSMGVTVVQLQCCNASR